MSNESAPRAPEQAYEHEPAAAEKQEVVRALPDKEHAEAIRKGENEQLEALAKQQESAEAARSIVEAESAPAEDLKTAPAAVPHAPTFIDRALKAHTLRRELQNIQRRESKADRAFSKVIHQPAVRAVSEVAGKTVSRPSGLLGGGFLALVGTSAYLYAARHYGFEYNYFVFILLFVGGFGAGLVLEFLMKLMPKKA